MKPGKFASTITITVHHDPHLEGMFEVDSEDYPVHACDTGIMRRKKSQIGPLFGCQCSWSIEDEPSKYLLYSGYCQELIELAKKIHQLHQ